MEAFELPVPATRPLRTLMSALNGTSTSVCAMVIQKLSLEVYFHSFVSMYMFFFQRNESVLFFYEANFVMELVIPTEKVVNVQLYSPVSLSRVRFVTKPYKRLLADHASVVAAPLEDKYLSLMNEWEKEGSENVKKNATSIII